MTAPPPPPALRLAALGVAGLLLAGCSSDTASGSDTTTSSPSAASAETVAAPQPRVTLTYDGGVLVLDATTLEEVGRHAEDGFLRVNPAGDGRHVLVTTEEGFQVLDTGVWTTQGRSYAGRSELTGDVFPADTAGHAVVHGDRTVLFADGTGDISSFATNDLLTSDGLPEMETWTSEAAHHGVAIELTDGRLLSTLGTKESRSGVRVLDGDEKEVARSEQCPGVHGEGTVAGEVAVFGCEDGVLVYDGQFTKLAAPAPYGRTGNIFTTETSPIAVGDHNDDPDAEGYELSQVALIDTATDKLTIVPLPEGVAYTFRDLARGPQDEAVVLGTDGSLHVLDEQTGALVARHPVVAAWSGPAEWQDPHPALKVVGSTAYVTEPAANAVHAVDLGTGKVLATGTLDVTPNEIAVVSG